MTVILLCYVTTAVMSNDVIIIWPRHVTVTSPHYAHMCIMNDMTKHNAQAHNDNRLSKHKNLAVPVYLMTIFGSLADIHVCDHNIM